MSASRPTRPAVPFGVPLQGRGTSGVTLADVARVAGVSTITASRALGNPSLVSAAAQARVREAVASTGYIPNFMAGGLKSRRSRLVACLVPVIAFGSAFLVAVQSMSEALVAAGYQVLLGERGYDAARELAVVEAAIARRPDAVVLIGVIQSEACRSRLRGAGMPVVEAWDMSAAPIDMLVGFSHAAVGRAMADHLHGRGLRRLGQIASTEPRGAERSRGFAEAVQRLGLAGAADAVPTHTVDGPTRLAHGRQGLAALLAAHPDIEAVACATDLVALGVLIEARARGIRVPDALAVIGFGDLDFAADTDPPLTTVNVDGAEIGRRAAALVIARIEGRHVAQPIVDLGFRLIERASV